MIGTPKQITEFLEDKTGVWEIKQVKGKKLRSYKQVKYYWGVLIKLVSEHTGDLPLEVNNQNKILFKKDTFTDLDTSEFETYMEALRQFYMYHLHYNIPKPNEDQELESLEKTYTKKDSTAKLKS